MDRLGKAFVRGCVLLGLLASSCGQSSTKGDAATDGTSLGDTLLDAAADNLAADSSTDGATDDARGPDRTTDDASADEAAPMACNGSTLLCDRTYDQVAYACTHNAMSNKAEGWWAPNQYYGITRQLKDGVRALMLDTHEQKGEAWLCHGPCALGQLRLADGLAEIRAFLEANPGEIVSIIFEAYASPEWTQLAFEEAGLLPYLHEHTPGQPWPTLREMVASGQRLVVFTDSGGGTFPWYMPVWYHAFETNWDNKAPSDFTCDVNRGNASNALFILNHFITNPTALPDLAEQVNFNPFFIERALQCQQERGHIPNFVTVDFYTIGDVMDVVGELNGSL